jgi:hypothetical protein
MLPYTRQLADLHSVCGVQEAAYHSVPVVTIPLSLGQEEISQFAVDQGRGLLVRKETLMAGQHQPLLEALVEIVRNNSGYKAQVGLLAAVVCALLPCSACLVHQQKRQHARSLLDKSSGSLAQLCAHPVVAKLQLPGFAGGVCTARKAQLGPWLVLQVLCIHAAGVLLSQQHACLDAACAGLTNCK